MTIVMILALAAVAAAPVAVRLIGRLAGWPLAALFAVAAALLFQKLPGVLAGDALEFHYRWIPALDISLSLRADALSLFFALLALCIGAVVFIYSAAYLPRTGNTSFYTLMSAFMAAILLLVFADDVFVLFIGWELVSLASFMLIARSGGKGGELGSQRTLILTFFGGLTLLVALAVAAVQAGTTSVSGILASDFWVHKPAITTTLAVLIAISAFTKSAQFPFHFWLPEAMAAATPVSAFLHAAAVVKAGIYLLMRFSPVFSGNHTWNYLLIGVGMFTAVMASLFAIQKTDLKKLTAYSTVSHLGWIVATIGVGTHYALAAALVHTLAHALFKSSLFMLIGVVDHQTGTRNMERLGSSWRQMPFTFGSVVVAAASMAAVPPTMGFISKEGMLESFTQAPMDGLGIVVFLGVAAVGAFFTFTYSARIVCDGFIDGDRDMSEVTEAPVALWLPAALPGLLSLPLAFAVGSLDYPITVISGEDTHLALWHGFTTPLAISLVVLAAGAVGVVYRRRIWALLSDASLLPYSGNELLGGLTLVLSKFGKLAGTMADSLSPTRHLSTLFSMLVLLAGSAAIVGLPLEPRFPGGERVYDLLPLAIVAITVAALVRTRKRLTAVVLIGAVGIGVTLQILMLGAPDVALTQFMVEALTVVIMMMIVRQQPENFHAPKKKAAFLAIAVGVSAFAMVYFLLGRRDRSELAQWYLDNGPRISTGNNVVNTILVEFRAFDTMGELSVLGMSAIVIAAVVTSMPRYPFARGAHPVPFGQSRINSIPLKVLLKVLIPVLMILSLLVFWRGHQAPGGGFIAALIAGGALMLSYLSFPRDKRLVPVRTPLYLTGVGMLFAIGDGLWGLSHGSFLYAIHGEGLGQHWTSAMIFDLGVYLAVLGMLSMAINALGGYLRPGMEYQDLNFTREDSPLSSPKTVEEELAAHLDDFGDHPRTAPEGQQQQILRRAKQEAQRLEKENS